MVKDNLRCLSWGSVAPLPAFLNISLLSELYSKILFEYEKLKYYLISITGGSSYVRTTRTKYTAILGPLLMKNLNI